MTSHAGIIDGQVSGIDFLTSHRVIRKIFEMAELEQMAFQDAAKRFRVTSASRPTYYAWIMFNITAKRLSSGQFLTISGSAS